MMAKDEGLAEYLEQVLGQLEEWLSAGKVQCLVLVVNDMESHQAVERFVDIIVRLCRRF